MTELDDLLGSLKLEELARLEVAKYEASYFEQDYWKEDLPNRTGNRGLSYDDPDHRNRFRWLFDELLGGSEYHGSLLDAGCGPGLLLENALEAGLDAYGLDISSTARNIFNIRTKSAWENHFHTGSLSHMQFADKSFKTCICLDALEHLVIHDALKAVLELSRVTKSKLICSINSDNPYLYHPTILSCSSWISLFTGSGKFVMSEDETERLNQEANRVYPEYTFYIFQRKSE